MILVKPYQIAAGSNGSRYDVPGSKFFLLAASEPLNIVLYAGTQRVGEIDGMQGGLEVGPFCPELTGFNVTTQSGLAGSAIIGIGEEDMSYNPLAGTLTFTNPAINSNANATPATSSAEALQSLNQLNFSAFASVAAVASQFCSIEIGNGGIGNAKTATITGVILNNKGAATVSVQLGTGPESISLTGGTVTPVNVYSGGRASVFNVYEGVDGVVRTPPQFNLMRSVQLAAGEQAEIDLTKNPIILPAGVVASFVAQCTTADSPVDFEVHWTET